MKIESRIEMNEKEMQQTTLMHTRINMHEIILKFERQKLCMNTI